MPQPATILVVDDLPQNRQLIELYLVRLGHRVMQAANGREAIDLLRTQRADLIMLDIMMPVMDGFETLTILKADPALRHTPVVVVSALNSTEDVARCISLGADDFLFKPVDRVLLDARVEACLVRKRLHDREQAALAAAESANRAKSDFVAILSHELKNPITGIAGYADLLLLQVFGPITAQQEEGVRVIRSLANLTKTLLADLTDLSEIDSGHLRLDPSPSRLAVAAAAASNTMRTLLADRHHRLRIDIPPDLPLVMADEVRLIQILTNLLSNAGKYTPPYGSIVLSAAQLDAAMIEVSVRDSGIGIPANEQDRIFSPFFRTMSARDGGEPGSGLGLNITRRLVELQGGRIWFSSAPNAGSTFSFTLPVAHSATTHPK
ncbi:hybrid sensor histidine kinase/response regulator [Oscillochloris sp. ZM17-4]|nr:hybrid sensor histidine kinase/response regulator [Oscillochloris sp. ZM17-4]